MTNFEYDERVAKLLGKYKVLTRCGSPFIVLNGAEFQPSYRWGDLMPLVQEYSITTKKCTTGEWEASNGYYSSINETLMQAYQSCVLKILENRK